MRQLEFRGCRKRLRRDAVLPAAQPLAHLLAERRKPVERHPRRHVFRLCARPLRHRFDFRRVRRPFRLVGAIFLVGLGEDLDELDHEVAVLLRPILVDNVAVECRLAGFSGDLAGRQNDLAVFLHFGQHRVPDKRRLNVAALPRCAHFRRTHIEDLHVGGIHLRLFERDHRVEVRRRVERHRDLLALEIGDGVDPRAVFRDERLGIADVVEDPEELVRLAARHGRGDARRTDFPNLYGARRHRLDDFAAAAELLPIDFVTGRLFDFLRVLRDAVRIQHVLVPDRHFFRLRKRSATDQRRRCEHHLHLLLHRSFLRNGCRCYNIARVFFSLS